MASTDTGHTELPSASQGSQLAAGLAVDRAEEAAADRLARVLGDQEPAVPPQGEHKGGRISLPPPATASTTAVGGVYDKNEETAARHMEQALSIAQGPPATPERPPPRDRDLGTKSNTLSAEATIAPHRNTVSDAFKDVESRLSKIPWMNTLETRTGMAKSLIATILSSLLLFTLFTGIAIRPLTVAFALAYPTYRVIDLAQRHQLEREWPQWLTYFAIVALINAADSFARPLLLFVLPSFDLIRLVVIGWMGALPGNNGAATLFNNIQER